MNYSELIIYLFFMFITPGPSNVTVLYLGAEYGIRGAQRFIVESASTYLVKFLLCAFLNLLLASVIPGAVPYLKWVGGAYMLYLAYGLVRAGFAAEKESRTGEQVKAKYPSGIALQAVNAKSWITCISICSVYVMPYTTAVKDILIAAALTMLFMLGSTYIWCISGKMLEKLYKRHRRLFSIIFALGLVYCAVMAMK